MTISSTNRKAGPFTGNGVPVAFPFTFKVFTATDVLVVQAVTATGAETTLALGTNYTVSLNADQNANPGGTVTAAPPVGTTLVVTSQVGTLQPVDLTNAGGFYPKVINDALDRAAIQTQQLAEAIGRTVRFPITEGPTNPVLPGRAARKGRLLAFHETTGDPAPGPSIATVDTVAGAVAAIHTVSDSIASVNTVAASIGPVKTVAEHVANVDTTAGSIASVNTVAGSIASVNTAAANMAAILAAPAQAQTAIDKATLAVAAATTATNSMNAAIVATHAAEYAQAQAEAAAAGVNETLRADLEFGLNLF